MIMWLRHLLGWVVSVFRSRQNLILENLARRQQLLTLHARRPRRRLTSLQKLFWVALRRLWAAWEQPLILVSPRTVMASCRFSPVLEWISRATELGGRKPLSEEIRTPIFRMAAENPTWGAPRIHGELLKLGFALSEATVSRWMRRAPRIPDVTQRWLTFLLNHREAIAAMDFFTVPTLTFGVLYCFFPYVVIEVDPDISTALRTRGIPSIFGDAAHSHLLERPEPLWSSLLFRMRIVLV